MTISTMAHKYNIMDFLEKYRRHPCLWDKSHSDYRNHACRTVALETLLPVSGLTNIKDLKQKIRSLRCTYNQEISKIKQSMTTGAGAYDVFKPKLAWFNFADSFLRKNIDDESSVIITSNENSNIALKTEETNDSNKSLECFIEIQEYDDESETVSEENLKRQRKTAKYSPKMFKKKKYQQSKIDNSSNNVVEEFKQTCSNQSTTENEFDVYGKHVAIQLKQLPLQDALQLQVEIQYLLTKARLQSINNSISNCNKSS